LTDRSTCSMSLPKGELSFITRGDTIVKFEKERRNKQKRRSREKGDGCERFESMRQPTERP